MVKKKDILLGVLLFSLGSVILRNRLISSYDLNDVGEQQKLWWLNTINPTFREILRLGAKGQTVFKVLKTGQMESTRYLLLK